MGFAWGFFDDLRTSLYKNAIRLIVNTVTGSVIGFLFWVVVARIYPSNEVGLAAAIILVSAYLGMLSRLGFDIALVRFLPSAGKMSKAMINSCFAISGVAAFLISLTFLMGMEIWSPALLFIRTSLLFTLSFLFFSVIFALHPLMDYVFIATKEVRFVLYGTLIGGSRIMLPVLLVSAFGAFGIFASWGIALLLAMVVGMFFFMPLASPGYRPELTVRKDIVRKMAVFSAGNYVSGIMSLMPIALIPLIIVNVLSAEDVAYYYVAFMIANIIFAIIASVCMSLFVEGSYDEKELRRVVCKAIKLLAILLAPLIVAMFLLGNHILSLFGSEYITEGFSLLQVYVASSVFMAINGVFLATRRVLKQLKPIIVIPLFNAFAIIGLTSGLLNQLGLISTAIAWTVSQGIVSLAIGVYLVSSWKNSREAGLSPVRD